jgi:outer membrane protein assembly factor BamB
MQMHAISTTRQSLGYIERAGDNLSQSLKRLSSGSKITHSGDDAASLAVSLKLGSAIHRSGALAKNIQNGNSFLETQDSAHQHLGTIITRMAELRTRFDDPTLNTQDGKNLNHEFKELQQEAKSLSAKKFNGISLFSSESDSASQLRVNTAVDGKNTSSSITRNAFFKAILENSSTGSSVGDTFTTQATFGSYSGTVTPTAGSTPNQTVSGAGGTAPDQTVNALQGSTPGQVINGVVGGTVSAQVVNALQGATTTQVVKGTVGGTTPAQTVNGAQGATPDQIIKAVQGSAGSVTLVAPQKGTPPTPFTLNSTPNATPDLLWKSRFDMSSVDGFGGASPVIDNGKIIVRDKNGTDSKVFSLDSRDGRRITEYAVNAEGGRMAEVSADTLYCGNGNSNELLAFDKATGAEKWRVNLGGPVWNKPLVGQDGNVYVGSNGAGGGLFSIDPGGNILWNTPLGSATFHGRGGFTQANDGTLYLAGRGGALRAVNPVDGSEVWQNGPLGDMRGQAVVAPDQSVIVNAGDGTTYAFNPDGSAKWTYANGSPVQNRPAVAPSGNVFLTQTSLDALDSNGNLLWSLAGNGYIGASSPVYEASTDTVYVTQGPSPGSVIAVDATSGTEKWRYTTGGKVWSTPALDANGNLYVANNNGDFFAISTIGPPADLTNVGSGYDLAKAAPGVVIDGADKGSLTATATVNGDGTLNVAFSGRASGTGNLTVTVMDTADTPPLNASAGSNYLPTETAPGVRVLADGIASKPASLKTGLVALFDGDAAAPAGGGAVADASGAGNNGTVASAQAPTQETKDRRTGAGAYVFDGANDKILLGDLPELSQGNELTVSAWVYRNDTGDDRIVCKSPSTNVVDHIFSLGVTSAGGGQSRITARIGTDEMDATNLNGSLTFPTNEWTHLSMSYDGMKVRTFVNGAQDPNVHDVRGNLKSSFDLVTIGNVNNGADRHFNGKLDDVGIWNRALTAAEIQSLAGPGNLTAAATINADGTLKLTPSGTSATDDTFSVEIDSGKYYLNNLSGIGSNYDGGTPEANPTVTITGADAGTASGTATVRADGKIDVALSGTPTGAGNLTLKVNPGIGRAPANLSGIGSGYDGATPEANPVVTITGADKGTLAGTATVKADGTIDVAFAGAPTGTGNLTVSIADGLDKPPTNLAGIGSGYDPGEAAPAVTITGTDKGTLAGTATVNANGTLDVAFSGNPADVGNLNLDVAKGVVRNPADLANLGSGYDPAESVPGVTITGADKGTFAGTSSINADGTVNITFTGSPTGSGALNVAIADGLDNPPANLTGIGSGYDPAETAPTVTITGTDKGSMTGTATINANGTLDVAFSGNPADVGNLNLAVASGAVRNPAGLSGLGSGYDPTEAAPVVTITGADKGSLGAISSIKADGTLDLNFSGAVGGIGNLILKVADGVSQIPTLTGIGSGYSAGDPAPVVTINGADKGTLAASSIINADGTLDLSFSGSTTGPGNLSLSIANGLAHVANLSGVGSGYGPMEAAPTINVSGADAGSLGGTATIKPDGTLDLNFSGNASGTGPLSVQASNGIIQSPASVSGLGSGHDPGAPPPVVTINGADKGTLVGTPVVKANGTVDLSFSGTAAGTGPLAVILGGDVVSSSSFDRSLIDLEGDLWDFSIADFNSYTQLLAESRAINGAEQNGLNHDWDRVSSKLTNLESAYGRINDTDMAQEMTEMSKSMLVNQSAAKLLAQHNRINSNALLTLQQLGSNL